MPEKFLWVLWWKKWYWGTFISEYIRNPLFRNNLESKPSEYARNPDNWIFLGKYAKLKV
jgi:hypothetical protein